MGRKKTEDWSEKDTEIMEASELEMLEEDVELLNELEEETEVTKKTTKKAKAKSKKAKEPTAEDLASEITQIFEEPKEIDFSEEIEEEVRPPKAEKKAEKKKEEKKPAPIAAITPLTELPEVAAQPWTEVAEASKLTSANLQKISGELKELLNQVRVPASKPSPMAKIAIGVSGLAMVFSLLSLNFSQSVRYAFFEQQRLQAETVAHNRQVREQREQHRASSIQVERPNSEVAKALPEARINKLKATTPKSKKY